MKGTFPYCRTKEAIKRIVDGDIIQNISTEQFFKEEHGKIHTSFDCHNWEEFKAPIETFPPYEEWRSISNLHYYDDIKEVGGEILWYLTRDDKVISETDTRADKSKKRWFFGNPLE